MRFNWLGNPSVEKDGVRVGFETRKALALLVFLSMREGLISREALSLIFWPDFERARAFANLRRTLSSLRSSLGEGFLDIGRDAIGLENKSQPEIDIREFQSLVGIVRSHRHAEGIECQSCLNSLASAVALYKADFLFGFNVKNAEDFEEWQNDQRENLRLSLAWALERLAKASLLSGVLETALDYAKRWTLMDVYNERARRTLMLGYALSGRPGAALQHYEEYEGLLWSSFGEKPCEEMREFRGAIGSGNYDFSSLERVDVGKRFLRDKGKGEDERARLLLVRQ